MNISCSVRFIYANPKIGGFILKMGFFSRPVYMAENLRRFIVSKATTSELNILNGFDTAIDCQLLHFSKMSLICLYPIKHIAFFELWLCV